MRVDITWILLYATWVRIEQHPCVLSTTILPSPHVIGLSHDSSFQRGGLARGHGVSLFAFGGAYWPLALAHSDPLWVQTCVGRVKGVGGGCFFFPEGGRGNETGGGGLKFSDQDGRTRWC